MNYACLLLPFPPTVNNLFSNYTRGGKQMRVPTKGYVAWQREADAALMQQKPLPAFDSPVAVTITLGRPDRRRRDIANLEKAPTDQIVKAGVLADDCLIEKITLQWGADVTGCRYEIESMVTA